MTVAQAAQRLGLKPSIVRRYVQSGRLKAKAITPRLYLIEAADLEAFAAQPRRRGRPRKRTDGDDG